MTRHRSRWTISILGLLGIVALGGNAMGAPDPGVYLGASTADPALAPLPPAEPSRGWPFNLGQNFGSPVLHDLNGDGVMEVIAGNRSSLYVLDLAGNVLPGWPQATGSIDNSPAVADVDEDGAPEIFAGAANFPPQLYGFNPDGSRVPGFPVNLPTTSWMNISSPAIADVDGDGHLDVGAQSESGVSFFDRFGHALPGWPYLWGAGQNIVWSAPAVADLDRDGYMEVVVGNNLFYNWSIHAIRHNGTAMPGWPILTNNIFASPSVGDLDGDGDLEIVVQEGDPTWYGCQMHVLHHDGTYLPGWPHPIAAEWECSRSNPEIVDVDGDGNPEIATATGDGLLHLIHPDGSEFPGYPRAVSSGHIISSATAIDVDADGIEELFIGYYEGSSQYVGGWTLAGAALPGFPKLILPGSDLAAHSSVHLADADGDGVLELAAQGQSMNGGRLWVMDVDGSVYDPATSRADWPKIRHDTRNTGYFARPQPEGLAGDELGGSLRLRVFPNPSVRGAALRLAGTDGAAGSVTLFDAAGRKVGERAVAPGSGIYLLRWTPAEGGRPRFARMTVLTD